MKSYAILANLGLLGILKPIGTLYPFQKRWTMKFHVTEYARKGRQSKCFVSIVYFLESVATATAGVLSQKQRIFIVNSAIRMCQK